MLEIVEEESESEGGREGDGEKKRNTKGWQGMTWNKLVKRKGEK